MAFDRLARPYDSRPMTSALFVALLALAFTILSFWWLHARAGWLEAATPRTYAFVSVVDRSKPEPVPSTVRLRLPLAFFNTGAKALIVSDLRLVLDDDESEPLLWITTRSKLRPESGDEHAYPTPFAVAGRGTKEVIAEFGHDRGWAPEQSSQHGIRLQARVHPSDAWENVRTFDWWAPPSAQDMGSYLVYENTPPQPAEGE
jgi:hypothetical protein